MTEESRPQSGEEPGDGVDCGAYRGEDWTSIFNVFNRAGGMIHTLTGTLPAAQTDPNIGVFYQVANRLEVTSPGASQISIATGCSQVDGRLHINDTAITATPITIPAGGANSRIDRVVVRQNYTLVDYPSVNAPALVVDFNTARICIISGVEAVGPVAPTLTQDTTSATYWDIPLAQYEIIHTTGVISNLTDEREWVDAEIKYDWATFHAAYNTTDGVDIVESVRRGFGTPANKISNAFGTWRVPQDYISDMSCKIVVIRSVTGGNIRIENEADHGACGVVFGTNVSTFPEATVAIANDTRECIAETTLDGNHAGAAVAAGDIVNFNALRGGTHVDDNCGTVYYVGELITYLGWNRR